MKIYLPLDWFYCFGSVILTDNWVSNGRISVRRECVSNMYNFESKEAVAEWDEWLDEESIHFRFFDNEEKRYSAIFEILQDANAVKEFGLESERVALGDCPYKNRVVAIHADNHGTTNAYFDRKYIDGLYFSSDDKLYGTTNMTAFFDAPKKEDITRIIMPVKP